MAENIGGPHLIESPAEREVREQTEERRQNSYRKLQVLFNGVLAAFTILTAGMVLYQNRVLNLSLMEARRQADATIDSARAARDAVAIASDTLNSGNESFAKTLAEMKAQSAASRETAAAAKRSADQGEKSFDASILNTQLSERPWINFGGFRMSSEISDEKEFYISYQLFNTGKTPALEETSQTKPYLWYGFYP